MMARVPIQRSAIPALNGRSVQLPPKQRQEYYATPEHVAWAKAVRDRAGHQCERCGRTDTRLYAHHVKEIKDGGTWTMANGVCICGSCHTVLTMMARAKRWTDARYDE
jgi:5-methylcytosine-specific restriction enzyme A